MNPLKPIFLTAIHISKELLSIPKSVADARKNRRQARAEALREAERLDRIRNPSDYEGK